MGKNLEAYDFGAF